MKLFETVAVVTNGAQGVGLTLATSLIRDGASVTITDPDPARGRDAVETLQGHGGALQHADCVTMDTADRSSVDAAARTILAGSPAIDSLVNIIRGDLRDALFPTRAFLAGMTTARRGKIINVLCEHDDPNRRPNKPDVVAMTQRLAGELGGIGISVNCLCVGPTLSRHIETLASLGGGFQPTGNVLPHPGAAQRIGDIITFFAGSASDYLNGEVLNLHARFGEAA